jgi:hypothetical protein
MDAENAIREASEIAVLINDGRMVLIGERYGEAKQQEAYQFCFEMLPIWTKQVAKFKKEIPWRKLTGTTRKKEKQAAMDVKRPSRATRTPKKTWACLSQAPAKRGACTSLPAALLPVDANHVAAVPSRTPAITRLLVSVPWSLIG